MSTLRDELAALLHDMVMGCRYTTEEEFAACPGAGYVVHQSEAGRLLASPPIARLVRVEAAARAVLREFTPEHMDAASGSTVGTDLRDAIAALRAAGGGA